MMIENSNPLLILLLVKFCCTTALLIFVKPDEIDNSLCCQNRTLCHTLSNSSQYFNFNDAEFVFLAGLHNLDRNVSFENLKNITLKAENMSSTEILCTGDNNGFSFQNITNLRMNGLTFTSCGMTHWLVGNSQYFTNPVSAGLYLNIIVNLLLKNITVQNSTGYNLFLTQIYGTSTIQNSIFKRNNGISGSLDGGNAMLMYQAQEKKTNGNPPASVRIEKSKFLFGKSFRFASGLLVIVTCFGMQLHVVETEMLGNTAAYENCTAEPSCGGNLALLFHDYGNSNITCTSEYNKTEVVIHNSNITFGKSCIGGGVFAKFTSSHKVKKEKAVNVTMSNLIIGENVAETTGGAVFLQLNSQVKQNHKSWIIFKRCSMIHNKIEAKNLAGAAMTVTSSAIGTHHLSPMLVLNEIQFSNNGLTKNNSTPRFASVLFVSQCMDGIQLGNGTNFKDNSVTAISLLHSSLTFCGDVNLTHNTGYTGGGLALHEVSYLFLTASTTLTISYNKAMLEGGGIFVADEPVQMQNEPCFYQIDKVINYAKIVLIKNTAPYGSQIYGGRIESCIVEYTGQNNFSDIFQLENTSSDYSVITSVPEALHFCNDNNVDYNNTVKSFPHSVFSGESFNLSLAFTGQCGGITHGKPRFYAHSKNYHNKLTMDNEKCMIYKVSIVTRKESESLDIQAVAANNDDLLFRKPVGRISLNVSITATPLGMVSTGEKHTPYNCIENPKLTDHHFECKLNKSEGVITTWPPYWLGYDNSSSEKMFALYNYCPVDYCVDGPAYIHTNSEEIDLDAQCANNRRGVLCGQCKHGYSLSLGTTACRNCSHVSIADTFGIVLGFASIGVVLILIFYGLNAVVTQGTLSGFLFYMNVVYVYWVQLQPNSNGTITIMLRLLVFGANLVLGCNCCLYDGMDMVGRTWAQFLLVVYLWALVGVVVLASRHFKCVNKWAGNRTVPVLTMIMLMSHTSLSLAIIHSLSWAELKYKGQTNNTIVHQKVLLYSGHLHYFNKGRHIPLFVVSCILGSIGACFMFILLCIQPLQKYSNFALLNCVDRFKPVFDAFTHPHLVKAKYRFWSGFLLLARSVIYIIYVSNIGHNSKNSLDALSITTFTIFLIQLCLGGVYTKKHLNVTFSFYMLNLFLLSVYASSKYPCKSSKLLPPSRITSVSHAFMISAILVYLGTLGYHIYPHIKALKCTKRLYTVFKRKRHSYQALESCVEDTNRCATSSLSSSLFTPRNIHPPLSITYREPQLKDYDSI